MRFAHIGDAQSIGRSDESFQAASARPVRSHCLPHPKTDPFFRCLDRYKAVSALCNATEVRAIFTKAEK